MYILTFKCQIIFNFFFFWILILHISKRFRDITQIFFSIQKLFLFYFFCRYFLKDRHSEGHTDTLQYMQIQHHGQRQATHFLVLLVFNTDDVTVYVAPALNLTCDLIFGSIAKESLTLLCSKTDAVFFTEENIRCVSPTFHSPPAGWV